MASSFGVNISKYNYLQAVASVTALTQCSGQFSLVYQCQDVVLAGVALAWLHLTVLGFYNNTIPRSNAYSLCRKEVLLWSRCGFLLRSITSVNPVAGSCYHMLQRSEENIQLKYGDGVLCP